MSKIAVVPDVHGEKFWRDILGKTKNYGKIIFLGDYFDPYDKKLSPRDCVLEMLDIMALKRAMPDKVVLLLGNHDLAYMFNRSCCRQACGDDYELIRGLLINNIECFDLTYWKPLEGIQQVSEVIFSHAGITKSWIEYASKYFCGKEDLTIDAIRGGWLNLMLRNAFDWPESQQYLFLEDLLLKITSARGGLDKFGSPVWADDSDWTASEILSFTLHVVGHSKRVKLAYCWDNLLFTDLIKPKITELEFDKGQIIINNKIIKPGESYGRIE